MRQASKQAHTGQRGENGPGYPQSHRRHHSAEEKIRIVLEGLRGENSIAELCRKEGTTSRRVPVKLFNDPQVQTVIVETVVHS